MGTRKSITAKRKQRKRQQRRRLTLKRLLTNQPVEPNGARADASDQAADAPITQQASSDTVIDQPTTNDSAPSAARVHLPPGPSRYSTGVVCYGGIRDEDKAKLRFIQSLPLKEQVIELHKLFYDRTEVAAYFRDKCVKKEEEMDALVSEFDIRVKQVRHFWQDLIYNERSRAGKLLKQSMQQL